MSIINFRVKGFSWCFSNASIFAIFNRPYGAVATHLTCNEKIRGSNPRAGCDTVAEWLRRWIANPLLFERESSNLSGVAILFLLEASTMICFGLSAIRSSPLISLNGEFGRFHGTYPSIYLPQESAFPLSILFAYFYCINMNMYIHDIVTVSILNQIKVHETN